MAGAGGGGRAGRNDGAALDRAERRGVFVGPVAGRRDGADAAGALPRLGGADAGAGAGRRGAGAVDGGGRGGGLVAVRPGGRRAGGVDIRAVRGLDGGGPGGRGGWAGAFAVEPGERRNLRVVCQRAGGSPADRLRSPPGWRAVAVAAGADEESRVLWQGTGGRAAVSTLSPADAVPTVAGVGSTPLLPEPGLTAHGPFDGWEARAVAAGPEGETQVLWADDAQGKASLWRIAATGAVTRTTLGPYVGWRAVALAAGSRRESLSAESRVILLG